MKSPYIIISTSQNSGPGKIRLGICRYLKLAVTQRNGNHLSPSSTSQPGVGLSPFSASFLPTPFPQTRLPVFTFSSSFTTPTTPNPVTAQGLHSHHCREAKLPALPALSSHPVLSMQKSCFQLIPGSNPAAIHPTEQMPKSKQSQSSQCAHKQLTPA